MKVMARYFALIVLLALVVAAPLAAQSTQQQQQQPPPPAKQPTPAQPGATGTSLPDQPAAPPVNKEEEDAYKLFLDTKDDKAKVQMGESFQEKYPTSRYRELVFASLSGAYQNLGQTDKMFAACDKTLEINPNNVAALVTITKGLARLTSPDALDAQQKFDKVEKYGKQALDLLSNLTKPEGMTDEKFETVRTDALADIHSGLGLVYLKRQRVPESIAELDQAVKVTKSPDPVDFYLLGLALQATKRFDDSASAFKSCAEATSQLQDACKQKQAEAQKQAAAAPKPAAPAPPKP